MIDLGNWYFVVKCLIVAAYLMELFLWKSDKSLKASRERPIAEISRKMRSACAAWPPVISHVIGSWKVYVVVEAAEEVAVEVVLVVLVVCSSSNSHQSCHRFFKVKRCDQQHLFPTKAGGALGSSHLTELEQERCWSWSLRKDLQIPSPSHLNDIKVW